MIWNADCTGCKGKKCHPFNSRRGRLIRSNIGCKCDSFLRKGCFFLSFVHVMLLISLEIKQKKKLQQ